MLIDYARCRYFETTASASVAKRASARFRMGHALCGAQSFAVTETFLACDLAAPGTLLLLFDVRKQQGRSVAPQCRVARSTAFVISKLPRSWAAAWGVMPCESGMLTLAP